MFRTNVSIIFNKFKLLHNFLFTLFHDQKVVHWSGNNCLIVLSISKAGASQPMNQKSIQQSRPQALTSAQQYVQQFRPQQLTSAQPQQYFQHSRPQALTSAPQQYRSSQRQTITRPRPIVSTPQSFRKSSLMTQATVSLNSAIVQSSIY